MASAVEYSIVDTDGPLGAEVTGFDPDRPLDDERFTPLMDAILARQLLVLRDCPLTQEQQVALSRHFGPLPPHHQSGYHDGGNPEIFVITNIAKDGSLIQKNPDPTSSVWHIDGSWGQPRTSFTMLRGIEVPTAGGDTEFTNTFLAFESLPPERQRFLESMEAVHDLAWSVEDTNPEYHWPVEERRTAPVNRRPVVVPHTVTGRKAVYLGQHAASIVGMGWTEGRSLIHEINEEAGKSEFRYAHKWRANDVVIWDNRCLMHRSTPYDYSNERRLVHRTSMQDTI
jgi:alpha-ketoglutarate-dependent taurine dioxygenase